MIFTCQALEVWKVQSPSCLGEDRGGSRSKFCRHCKRLAKNARQRARWEEKGVHEWRLNNKRSAITGTPNPQYVDITKMNPTGYWIDRVCSNCGDGRVPLEHRFLCIPCHGEYHLEDHTIGVLEGFG